jgi:hypothetical protein
MPDAVMRHADLIHVGKRERETNLHAVQILAAPCSARRQCSGRAWRLLEQREILILELHLLADHDRPSLGHNASEKIIGRPTRVCNDGGVRLPAICSVGGDEIYFEYHHQFVVGYRGGLIRLDSAGTTPQ